MNKFYDWFYKQNTFIRIILQILLQLPFFLLGWILGELIW